MELEDDRSVALEAYILLALICSKSPYPEVRSAVANTDDPDMYAILLKPETFSLAILSGLVAHCVHGSLV